MTQVSSRAIGNPYHHRSGESGASTGTSVPAVRQIIGLILGVAALASVLAVRTPLTLTVLGLIAFGVLHAMLEIRYVAGRSRPLVPVAVRRSSPGHGQNLGRVVGSASAVGVAAVLSLRGHRRDHITRGLAHPTEDRKVPFLVEAGRIGPDQEEL